MKKIDENNFWFVVACSLFGAIVLIAFAIVLLSWIGGR